MIFGKWMNVLPTAGAFGAVGGLCTVVAGFWYYATPSFFAVGYMPKQPGGGFNHQLHAGKLGMDCRYCHTKVEVSAEANIPNVATCNGCHAEGHVQLTDIQQEKTKFIRDAFAADQPIEWRRVHKLPDYVRNFPHDVHVNAGVSCFSCHGQMASQPEVWQQHSMSMGWCLTCHRETPDTPEKNLVPRDKVTDLIWVEQHLKSGASAAGFDARQVFESLKMSPPTNCGACHY